MGVVNISSATLEIAVIMSLGDTTICAACHENITDKAMKAKNNFYHENHFVCSYSGCGLSLLKLSVYSKDGQLFCQCHYQEKFLSKCSKCKEYITGVCGEFLMQL